MMNETKCKILCDNLVVFIHERHEFGVASCSGMKGKRR